MKLLALICLIAAVAPVFAEETHLRLESDDIIIEEGGDGGYHLWIRKRGDISSVLLTESTADPNKRLDIYALRNPNYDPINGREKRILNGSFLEKNRGIVDSSPERHESLGESFHLFVPYVVQYGYPRSREGEIYVSVGTFLNVKAFSKPYADWSGETADNPFIIALAPEREQRIAGDGFLNEAVEEFSEIAERGGGDALRARYNEELVPKIEEVMGEASGERLDLVLALDTTLSMQDEMPYLKRDLVPTLQQQLGRFHSVRVGLILYRDYFEEYLVKPFPFSDSLASLQSRIDAIRVLGGKELPEAVHEALYFGIESYPWEADARQLILIGDAPPHARPRGKITEEMVFALAAERDVTIHTIILPQ